MRHTYIQLYTLNHPMWWCCFSVWWSVDFFSRLNATQFFSLSCSLRFLFPSAQRVSVSAYSIGVSMQWWFCHPNEMHLWRFISAPCIQKHTLKPLQQLLLIGNFGGQFAQRCCRLAVHEDYALSRSCRGKLCLLKDCTRTQRLEDNDVHSQICVDNRSALFPHSKGSYSRKWK